jgi:hypothetical protein
MNDDVTQEVLWDLALEVLRQLGYTPEQIYQVWKVKNEEKCRPECEKVSS